jgi:hypothetical protein
VPTGKFLRVFPGDPSYCGSDVTSYFVDSSGDAVLLQRADFGSRDELAKRRAARDARSAARAAEAKARREEARRLAATPELVRK